MEISGNQGHQVRPSRIDSSVDGHAIEPGHSGSQQTSHETDVTHVRSPEVKELVKLLQELPEIRSDVVQAARERVAAGHFLTDDAAEQTARAILQADQS